jgi:hypothetical protein
MKPNSTLNHNRLANRGLHSATGLRGWRSGQASRRSGLILLVVLGMLALFSLLAVTYVVFSGQSRSTSIALARSEIRGHKSHQGLMEEAIKSLIRGPRQTSITNVNDWVPINGHDMLGDIYGTSESAINVNIRDFQFNPSLTGRNNNNARSPMAIAPTSLQRPMILNGHFLRIPLDPIRNLSLANYDNPDVLPIEHDALNGRVVTFPPGSGPLEGQSFHIVRYIGNIASTNPIEFAQSYSITIDLNQADLEKSYSRVDSFSGQAITGSVRDWLTRQAGSGTWSQGLYVCYSSISAGSASGICTNGFSLLINAKRLNSHGVGVLQDGSSQMHYLASNASGFATSSKEINEMAVGLQPNYSEFLRRASLPITAGLNAIHPFGALTHDATQQQQLLAYNGTPPAATSRYGVGDYFYLPPPIPPNPNPLLNNLIPGLNYQNATLGDTDEPYDAADYATMFLSSTREGATAPIDVIPSFHRPALIQYIVNWKNPATWTEAEIRATLRRIELACLRPLSISITIGPPRNPIFVYERNPEFSGGNPGSGFAAPALNMSLGSWADFGNNGGWFNSDGTPGAFQQWVNALCQGPWDVDNNGDGISDSVWVEAGLPLETSPEGKLLKALVAFHVEDLDSKLDINAVGNLAQTNDRNFVFGLNDQYSANVFSQGSFADGGDTNRQYLGQGFGYGPAETSARHLFSKMPQLPGETAAAYRERQELAYTNLIENRYIPNPNTAQPYPGAFADDTLSQLHRMRERRNAFLHASLPGLPVSPNGRASIGMDRLGNPLVWNFTPTTVSFSPLQITRDSFVDETTNDPYEARLLSSGYLDSPYTLAEWERIYRVNDPDFGRLPSRLQNLFGETDSTLPLSTLKNEITPISRHLRLPNVASRVNGPNVSTTPLSTLSVVNTLRLLRGQSTFTQQAIRNLFPLEFQRGEGMNLNRPFGNGVDDDGDGQIDEPDEFSDIASNTYIGQTAYHANSQTTLADGSENYFESNTFSPNLASASARLASLGVDPLIDYTSGTPTPAIFWGQETRQLYARHLYCLAQLILPEDYVFPNVDKAYFLDLLQRLRAERNANPLDASNPPARPVEREYVNLRGRILAQWAVNVVDFRDADSVMTRFPFDPDPFRDTNLQFPNFNWQPLSGTIAPDINFNLQTPYVVWGLEQPEALLTESFATHDLRIRKEGTPPNERFTQYRIPQGSLFLEVYNPRTTASVRDNQNVPGLAMDPNNNGRGLYADNGSGVPVLNLGKLAPDPRGIDFRVPVWRIYITGPKDTADTNAGSPLDPPRSPRDRIMTRNSQTRPGDLTNQFISGNLRFQNGSLATGSDQAAAGSGLVFDYTIDTNTRLPEPNTADSRIIVFADGFVPSDDNCPGVVEPEAQVFTNQNGSAVGIRGGQYLVIGPRETTYFGSDEAATSDPTNITNIPNAHRITLEPFWSRLYSESNADVTQRGIRADCVTMIAALDTDNLDPGDHNWNWSHANTDRLLGVNVSEPLPMNYYPEPTAEANSSDTGVTDPPTGALGFGDLPFFDAYFDYDNGPVGTQSPLDDGSVGPLEHWDPDATAATTMGPGDEFVQPGTQLDWCTAYLQRLADPDKPFHPTFNPYITVDWIPIDLTVFNGEDNDSDFDPALSRWAVDPNDNGATELRFESRQKLGQPLDSRTLQYDIAAAAGQKPTGHTFLSVMTNDPQITQPDGSISESVLSVQMAGDDPSKATLRPTGADGTNTFSTFGFLNSAFQLSGNGAAAAVPPVYTGAPADPDPTDGLPVNPRNWRPDSLFWANRSFVNTLELMLVPLSAPGQLNQEFSATIAAGDESPYASAYRTEDAGWNDQDARTPTKPISPAPLNVTGRVNDTARVDSTTSAVIEFASVTPYSYLFNFLQEGPELDLDGSSPISASAHQRYAKSAPLTTLLDLVETPSPWVDAYLTETPSNVAWQDYTAAPAAQSVLVASANIVFGPYRAPYNQIPRQVEPGRVNLNTMQSTNVLHGLLANVLPPTDRDFDQDGTMDPTDIDHNQDGVFTVGQRTDLISRPAVDVVASALSSSRQGYTQAAGSYSGFYSPPADTIGIFNPHFPTRFASPFKPASEAGMVPKTRNPYAGMTTDEDQLLAREANERGVLDLYTRNNPVHTGLLRGLPTPATVADIDGDSTPDSAGVNRFGQAPALIADRTQRNPFTDFYPITRLKNLTTERSNVFAVYMTMAFFEYDPSTNSLGAEYGADRGEAERYKAFYIIDRSRPVGYQTGRDNNVEETILLRRYLNTDD